jgi:hypothetical protein
MGISRVLVILYPTRIREFHIRMVPVSVPTKKYLYPYRKIRPILILVTGTRPVFIPTTLQQTSTIEEMSSSSQGSSCPPSPLLCIYGSAKLVDVR